MLEERNLNLGMAAGLGFEPRRAAPKTAVLPLDDPATSVGKYTGHSVWCCWRGAEQDMDLLRSGLGALFGRGVPHAAFWRGAPDLSPRSGCVFHQISVRRESVCYADDMGAPHEVRVSIDGGTTVAEMLGHLICNHFLPSIVGGKAIWVFVGEAPIAVLAEQWEAPCFLFDPCTLATELLSGDRTWDFEFRYLVQDDPSEVLAALQG